MAGDIRVLIVDDHAVVREGQRALIETEPGMELVGEGADGVEAVDMAERLLPDVILIDLIIVPRPEAQFTRSRTVSSVDQRASSMARRFS